MNATGVARGRAGARAGRAQQSVAVVTSAFMIVFFAASYTALCSCENAEDSAREYAVTMRIVVDNLSCDQISHKGLVACRINSGKTTTIVYCIARRRYGAGCALMNSK